MGYYNRKRVQFPPKWRWVNSSTISVALTCVSQTDRSHSRARATWTDLALAWLTWLALLACQLPGFHSRAPFLDADTQVHSTGFIWDPAQCCLLCCSQISAGPQLLLSSSKEITQINKNKRKNTIITDRRS